MAAAVDPPEVVVHIYDYGEYDDDMDGAVPDAAGLSRRPPGDPEVVAQVVALLC